MSDHTSSDKATNWKRNIDGSWSLINPSPDNSWPHFNWKDQQEIILAQENCSFKFHGATKAVDDPSLQDNFSSSTISSDPPEVVNLDYNDILSRLNLLEKENQSLKNELKKVKSRVSELEDINDDQWENIYVLEKQLNRLDQYGRRENVEIVGIPNEVTDRDLEVEVIKILRAIGLEHLEHFNIVACHRLGTKDRNGRRNTIVRFVNRKDAILCLKFKRNLFKCKSMGYNNLYIVENLCPAYKSIYENLMQLKDDGKINKVWSFNGIINYKRTDDERERPFKVLHEYDIENIYNQSG